MRVVCICVSFLVFCCSLQGRDFPTQSTMHFLARSGPSSAYNLNFGDVIFDEVVRLGKHSEIYINTLYSAEGTNGIHKFDWRHGVAKSLFQLDGSFRTSEVLVLENSKLIASIYDQGKTYGLLEIDTQKASYQEILNLSDASSTVLLSDFFVRKGSLHFRFRDKDRGEMGFAELNSEGKLSYLQGVSSSQASYIFGPCANSKGDFAFKERVSSQGEIGEGEPDQLIFINGENKLRILQDQDSDPLSRVSMIYNQCSLSDEGRVAQLVKLENSQVGLWVYENTQSQILLKEGDLDIESLEYFQVKQNQRGEFLLRAIDKNKKRAIYLLDKKGKLLTKVTEGDVVSTDLGLAVLQHIRPSYPAFSGSPGLSEEGFAFVAYLTDLSRKKDLGHALFFYQTHKGSHGLSSH